MYYIQLTITNEDNGSKYDYRTKKNNQDIQSIQDTPCRCTCGELRGDPLILRVGCMHIS